MPRFFIPETVPGESYTITGENARHIGKSLRMQAGERVILCTPESMDYLCEITDFEEGAVQVSVLAREKNRAEPSVRIRLYQCLTKGDKFETIVQKSVELGANSITPVLSRRCISRPEGKAMEKKRTRWQKIAEEAAKQSGRGLIPQIRPLLSLEEALAEAESMVRLFFYEEARTSIRTAVPQGIEQAAVFIGSEGGFDPAEADLARKSGAHLLTLGPRILRTETAPLAALTALLFHWGEM